MKDKYSVNFDNLVQTIAPKEISYKLSDIAPDRIEKVAYDMVRFRDNQDTDQLWKIHDTPDGPVIVALYGDNGSLMVSDGEKSDWEVLPDKKAMHIFYKGEPLTVLSEKDIGIPAEEFSVVRRWLPKKLASDQDLQKDILSKIPVQGRKLIAKRFPELTKVACINTDDSNNDTDGLNPNSGLIPPDGTTIPNTFESIKPPENVEGIASKLKEQYQAQDIQKLINLLQVQGQ
jgi:hypothetical protein